MHHVDISQKVHSPTSSGGFRGGAPPYTAQNFLNFMQFFAKFGKIICWCPPRVGAPSYGESWIRPCYNSLVADPETIGNAECVFVVCSSLSYSYGGLQCSF